jgi:RNA polymerase sigma factor (sigma-70 family)
MVTNNLITENITFANILAAKKKSRIRSVSYEELQSAAYLGLVEAANNYDPDYNFIAFKSFAFVRINGAMKDYLRELRWGTRRRPVSMSSLEP